jgi:predicted transcriptional regulator
MMALLWRLNMSKQDLLLTHLEKGKAFTAKQISASFGIAHPASAIRNLREQGYCVYGNRAKLSTGSEVVKYRLGKPNRRMVALANRVYGAAIFTR